MIYLDITHEQKQRVTSLGWCLLIGTVHYCHLLASVILGLSAVINCPSAEVFGYAMVPWCSLM